VIVNSNQDGAVQPDEQLTLREAISLVNGSLSPDSLSPAEKAQVSPGDSASQIGFNLPAGQTTIQLSSELPPLASPGLVLDGTTQPGYEAERSAINELPMPVPVVAITPAEGIGILRGLTVAADRVAIRGLSLYGFTAAYGIPMTTPPADIFIAHKLPPPDLRKQPTPANFSPFYADDLPPRDVVIENNWLGIPPTSLESTSQSPTPNPESPTLRSAFGVYVFNGVNTIVRRNWIADHEGSAIITSVRAEGMQVSENVMTGNGVAGMPDAIRLEGNVNQTQISGNLICANDGSGVYLFKPEGAVQIQNNQITYNGRRFRRAAVYLMGSNHQVTDNQISYQAGPGVVVAAYPQSYQSSIRGNRFIGLEGLSIDLVTQGNTDTHAYDRGDGHNPRRDTRERRLETGNKAVNSPEFVTREFIALGSVVGAATQTPVLESAPTLAAPVQVFGMADPGSTVEIYRVLEDGSGYGPLTQLLTTVETDSDGKFNANLENLRSGDQISAIALHPRYGTSEPARNAVIRSLDSTTPPTPTPQPPTSPPRCTTPAAPPAVPAVPPVEPIRLQVPRNIHFALDRANISPTSARVLNRIAQVLRENPFIMVEIQGHTDPRASDAYNLDLGMRRAISARNYLLRQGIAPERMTIRSFGERQRIAEGNTRLDYARDRRVEFIYKDARNIEVLVQEEDLQLE
jgi:outer membrane protein OmpA-like peptidoglycan-associated protein